MSAKYPLGKSFMAALLNGEALPDDIDDYIHLWHTSETNDPLPKFLGLSEQEYLLWLEESEVINLIASSRMNNRSIFKEIEEFKKGYSLAARGSQSGTDTGEIVDWLVRTGRL